MNQLLFLFHIFLVVASIWGALRLGKEALITLIVLSGLLANLFVIKQIELFGLTVTCSDVFAIGGILGLNILQESFGKKEAQLAVRISFSALLFFCAMAWLHLSYIPSPQDFTQSSFSLILGSTPRLIAASFGVYYIVQKWDIYFFQWLQKKFKDRHLTLRLWASLFLSQALDTVLFSFLGLYGMVDSVFDIIVMSYAIKCCIILIASPMASFSKRWISERAA